MALRNAFEDMATDARLDAVLTLLMDILEKMPRVDVNDRLIVNTGDQGNVTVALATNQTLTTVTTVSAVTAVQTLGTSSTAVRDTSATPAHIANMGAMHLYNNIIVS